MINKFVMMNTGKKMNIHQAIEWFDIRHMSIIKARRYSYHGADELIYILGGYGTYCNRGDYVDYITDTGRGYGGRGKLFIEDVLSSGTDFKNKIASTQNILELNEVEKLHIWVLK